jgi:hypothetical protein
MPKRSLLVLLADREGGHVMVEVVPAGATSCEVERLARQRSSDVGIQLQVYASLPVADVARAVEQTRRLLRFNSADLASGNRSQCGRAALYPNITLNVRPGRSFPKSPV